MSLMFVKGPAGDATHILEPNYSEHRGSSSTARSLHSANGEVLIKPHVGSRPTRCVCFLMVGSLG